MKVLQEVTEWSTATPNHTYIVNDSKDKLYAYVRMGTRDLVKLSKPMKFYTNKRKFRELKETFGFILEEEKPVGQTWSVQGSKGDTYTVELLDGTYTCTCSGFKFRGKCKHIESVQNV